MRTIASIRRELFRHLSGLSVSFFHTRRTGDLISRLTNDVGSIQLSLRYLFGQLLQHPINIIALLVVAFWASWQLTLLVLLFFPLILIPLIRSGKKVKRHSRGSFAKLGEITEAMSQLLSGIRVVKVFGMENAQLEEFDQRNLGFVKSALKVMRAKITARSLIEGLYTFLAALALLVGGWMMLGTLTIGDLLVFLGAIASLYHPLKAISRAYNTIQESGAAIERVFEILEERPTVEDLPEAVEFPPFRDTITFENVSFRYGLSEPLVLRDIRFTARRGETIALVGPSGAGKSTLLDLLGRFHDPTEGGILLDGLDLRQGTQASLLRNLAVVDQDSFLFNTTVEENIRHGNLEATHSEIEAAAQAAAIHNEIMAMSEGYSTVIGERCSKVSGGQRQRITIARAILKNAPILILDEATSSLDSESERKIQEALMNLMKGRTTFVIAHRIATVKHVHQILVMDEGRIVAKGTHKELARARGLYARLLKLQEITEAPIEQTPLGS